MKTLSPGFALCISHAIAKPTLLTSFSTRKTRPSSPSQLAPNWRKFETCAFFMITRVYNPAYRCLKPVKGHKVQLDLILYLYFMPNFERFTHWAESKTLVSIF